RDVPARPWQDHSRRRPLLRHPACAHQGCGVRFPGRHARRRLPAVRVAARLCASARLRAEWSWSPTLFVPIATYAERPRVIRFPAPRRPLFGRRESAERTAMPTYTTRVLVSLLAGATVAATAITSRTQAPPTALGTASAEAAAVIVGRSPVG